MALVMLNSGSGASSSSKDGSSDLRSLTNFIASIEKQDVTRLPCLMLNKVVATGSIAKDEKDSRIVTTKVEFSHFLVMNTFQQPFSVHADKFVQMFCDNIFLALDFPKSVIRMSWDRVSSIVEILLPDTITHSNLLVKIISFFNDFVAKKHYDFFVCFLSKFFGDVVEDSDSATVLLLGISNSLSPGGKMLLDYHVHIIEHFSISKAVDHSIHRIDNGILDEFYTIIQQEFLSNNICRQYGLITLVRVFRYLSLHCLSRVINLLEESLFCDTCSYGLLCAAASTFFELKRGQTMKTLSSAGKKIATSFFEMANRPQNLPEEEKEAAAMLKKWWTKFQSNKPSKMGKFNPPALNFPEGCFYTFREKPCLFDDFEKHLEDNQIVSYSRPNGSETDDRDDGGWPAIIAAVEENPITMSNFDGQFRIMDNFRVLRNPSSGCAPLLDLAVDYDETDESMELGASVEPFSQNSRIDWRHSRSTFNMSVNHQEKLERRTTKEHRKRKICSYSFNSGDIYASTDSKICSTGEISTFTKTHEDGRKRVKLCMGSGPSTSNESQSSSAADETIPNNPPSNNQIIEEVSFLSRKWTSTVVGPSGVQTDQVVVNSDAATLENIDHHGPSSIMTDGSNAGPEPVAGPSKVHFPDETKIVRVMSSDAAALENSDHHGLRSIMADGSNPGPEPVAGPSKVHFPDETKIVRVMNSDAVALENTDYHGLRSIMADKSKRGLEPVAGPSKVKTHRVKIDSQAADTTSQVDGKWNSTTTARRKPGPEPVPGTSNAKTDRDKIDSQTADTTSQVDGKSSSTRTERSKTGPEHVAGLSRVKTDRVKIDSQTADTTSQVDGSREDNKRKTRSRGGANGSGHSSSVTNKNESLASVSRRRTKHEPEVNDRDLSSSVTDRSRTYEFLAPVSRRKTKHEPEGCDRGLSSSVADEKKPNEDAASKLNGKSSSKSTVTDKSRACESLASGGRRKTKRDTDHVETKVLGKLRSSTTYKMNGSPSSFPADESKSTLEEAPGASKINGKSVSLEAVANEASYKSCSSMVDHRYAAVQAATSSSTCNGKPSSSASAGNNDQYEVNLPDTDGSNSSSSPSVITEVIGNPIAGSSLGSSVEANGSTSGEVGKLSEVPFKKRSSLKQPWDWLHSLTVSFWDKWEDRDNFVPGVVPWND